MPRTTRFPPALVAALFLVAPPAFAQPAPATSAPATPAAAAPVGTELTEEARRTYAQGIREARELVAKKEFPAAIVKLDALNAQRPREPQARFLKGVVQTEEGQNEAALATFLALTSDFPELPEPYNNLAVLYAKKGEYEGARIALESAVQAAPDWAVAHENLGDVYVRIAAGEYERAAKLDKENKSAGAKLVLARDILAPAPKPTPIPTPTPTPTPTTTQAPAK